MDKAWKAFERRIAKYFGVYRNPLSGRMSRHTASDSLHPLLFIDCKLRREFRGAFKTFKAMDGLAKAEGKRPVLIMKLLNINDGDSLVTCKLKDLSLIAEQFQGIQVITGSKSSSIGKTGATPKPNSS